MVINKIFFNIIKNYSNVEKHYLKGVITGIESVEQKRFFVLKFYPMIIQDNLNSHNLQYCPIVQETLSLNDLIIEQYFEIKKKNIFNFKIVKKKKEKYKYFLRKKYLTKQLFLPLNNFTVNFEKRFWRSYFNQKISIYYINLCNKYFTIQTNNKLKKNLKKKLNFFKNINRYKNFLTDYYFKKFFFNWNKFLFKFKLLIILFFCLKKNFFFFKKIFLVKILTQYFNWKSISKFFYLFFKNIFLNKLVYLKFQKKLIYKILIKFLIKIDKYLKKIKSKFKLKKKKKLSSLILKLFQKKNFLFFNLFLLLQTIKFKLKKQWKIFFLFNLKYLK